MYVSPANVSIPALALSVNPPTEQTARDNTNREKIVSLRQPEATQAESAVSQNEKQLKKPAWDPFEHPGYPQESFQQESADPYSEEGLREMSTLLASSPYASQGDTGFSVKMKLPPEVLDRLAKLRETQRRAAVVALRYQQSTSAHRPSEVLIVI